MLKILDLIPVALQGGHFLGAEAGGIHIANHVAAVHHAALLGHIFNILYALLVVGGFVAHNQRVAGVGFAHGAVLHQSGAYRGLTEHILQKEPGHAADQRQCQHGFPYLAA